MVPTLPYKYYTPVILVHKALKLLNCLSLRYLTDDCQLVTVTTSIVQRARFQELAQVCHSLTGPRLWNNSYLSLHLYTCR